MDRREYKANMATWSVTLGALIGVVLFLGAAYSRQPLAGLLFGILIIAYLIVLAVIGRISVFHVLWGQTIDESDPHINRGVIIRSTVLIAIVAVCVAVYDALSSSDWGWFSWLAGLIAVGYLISLVRHLARNRGEHE